jgi:hypothetical protein
VQSFVLDSRQQLTSDKPSKLLKFCLGCIGSGLFGSGPRLRLLNTVPRDLEIPMYPFDERSSSRMQDDNSLMTAANVLDDISNESRLGTVLPDHFAHRNLAASRIANAPCC